MKCNLECSYCHSGTYGGRDNTTQHPPLAECLESIDFMFKYVDMYMSTKVSGIKYTILNIYGGEALHHPDIVEILKHVQERYAQYKDRWHLTITTTTNAIISSRKLQSILPYIDEFTVSYHVENTAKNKELFRNNLLEIKAAGKRQKCVVLMHPEQDLFEENQRMIAWLNENNIKYLPRQLDRSAEKEQFNYNKQQVIWFNNLYSSKGTHREITPVTESTDLAAVGRACCGGRQLCANKNYKEKHFFVDNKFTDWHCSVNHFFLFVKQLNGEIFVNKDCKMDFNGSVGPIGNLSYTQALLDQTQTWLATGTMPVIQCKKSSCWCGLCAPKAKTLDEFNKIFVKYTKKESKI